MATTPEVVFPEDELYRSVFYTGDNSADLNSLIDNFTITAETATQLTFTSGGTSYTVPRNSYIVYQAGVVTDTFLNANDLREAYGGAVAMADHYHEVILKSGPALAIAAEA